MHARSADPASPWRRHIGEQSHWLLRLLPALTPCFTASSPRLKLTLFR
ncbi:unnamed protein product [Ascophyllum nodosum]